MSKVLGIVFDRSSFGLQYALEQSRALNRPLLVFEGLRLGYRWSSERIHRFVRRIEGGAGVAGELHRQGLVDRYVLYVAPALFGGDDARPLFVGPGASTMADLWRGRLVDVRRVGEDLALELRPAAAGSTDPVGED